MIQISFRCPIHGGTVQPMGGIDHDNDGCLPNRGPNLVLVESGHTHEAEHYWTFDLSDMECEQFDSGDESCQSAWVITIEAAA